MYSEQTFDETQFDRLLDFVRKKPFVIINDVTYFATVI